MAGAAPSVPDCGAEGFVPGCGCGAATGAVGDNPPEAAIVEEAGAVGGVVPAGGVVSGEVVVGPVGAGGAAGGGAFELGGASCHVGAEEIAGPVGAGGEISEVKGGIAPATVLFRSGAVPMTVAPKGSACGSGPRSNAVGASESTISLPPSNVQNFCESS